MITPLKNTEVITHATLDAVFEAVPAAINLLARGTDANSHPLADGWSAFLVNVRDDWEIVADVLQYPRWHMNGEMCFKCGAAGIGTRGRTVHEHDSSTLGSWW